MPYSTRYLCALALGCLAAAGCGSDDNLTVPPTSGSLSITTATTGAEPDADGYLVQLDAGEPQAIGASATIQTSDLAAGAHSVQLNGIAPNCTAGENPRSVTVVGGETASVEFAVTCGATTGGVAVTVATSGPSPDADGYTLTLDGADRGPVGASGSVTVDGLSPGAHTIGLSGIAANCQLQGDNPQAVTVAAGAGAPVAFTVVCAAPPANAGSLKITTATGGSDLDANGYKVAVDGGTAQSISVNGSSTLTNLAAGSHSVRLTDVAQNCSLQGGNPRSVNVSAGATAEVTFTLTCSATSGSIKVTTATSGANPDPDGYAFAIDGGAARSIGVNATVTVDKQGGGNHSVALSGLASNCSVENNPRTITVAAGGTVEASFALNCTATPSSALQWQPMGSGTDLDLLGVWGSSATNVFVAGSGLERSAAAILHFDGQAWSEQHRESDLSFYSVWGGAGNDFFVSGAQSSESHGIFRHFDGSSWSAMAGHSLPLFNPDYTDLWGASGSDVFAVGGFWDGNQNAMIAHYDGSGWSTMTVPQEVNRKANGVSGTSSHDVFAVGIIPPSGQSFVWHYDGSSWTEGPPFEVAALTDVWSNSPSDVFAVGFSSGGGVVLHYDGSGWSPMALPPVTTLAAVWGSSPSDVYAVGDGILHYDGTRWSRVSQVQNLNEVWGVSSDNVFAVGSGGTILHGTR
jgi:hypothetical protein